MKKRFMNALLLGALVCASTSTFVSCKDYDDDINNLQTQIDKLATAEQLKSEIATLNTAVANAKAEALAKAQEALDKANAAQNAAANAATKEDLAKVKETAEKAQAAAEKAQTDLAAAKADLEALIASKADQADLDAANVKIAAAELAIAENKALAEAAQALAESKTDAASALAAAKAEVEAAKEALKELINAKADATTVTDATGRVEKLEAFVGSIEENKTLQDVVDAAVAAAIGETTSDASLASKIGALEAAVFAKTEDGLVNNIALIQEALKALQDEAAALKIAISEMITGIQLFGTEHSHNWNNPCNHTLTFTTISEQDNVFTAPDGTKLEFSKNHYTTYGDSVVVRVTPANATLTKEMVSLINSQGVALEDVEVESVEKFNTLLTRAAVAETGLWTIKFNLKKDYDAEGFAKAIVNNKKNVLFAVAAKTKLDETDVRSTRSVVSEFDLDMATENGVRAKDFTVNNTEIREIYNRFEKSEAGNSTLKIADLTWAPTSKDFPTPATEIAKDNKNVYSKEKQIAESEKTCVYDGGVLVSDYRNDKNMLAVEVGTPIVIDYSAITTNTTNASYWIANQKVAGFYVTLDKTHAVESGVSEINAWNSYKYTGLDTMLGVDENGNPTNKGTITIEDLNNVKGDIIGFRVFAVNLDGTLLDPDGRAFYVAVGDVATDGNIVAGDNVNIKINAVTGKSDIVACNDISVGDNEDEWIVSENNPKYNANGSTTEKGTIASPAFKVNYFKKDGKTATTNRAEAEFVQFVIAYDDLSKYIDGATYTQTKLFYDLADDGKTKLPVKTITATMTKVMPTDVPAYAFIPGQQLDADGKATTEQDYVTGKFRAYMKPENGYSAATTSTNGLLNMDNILYTDLGTGYDFANLKFNFVKASKDKKKDVAVEGNETLKIDESRIDNKTEFPVEVSYLYRGISTKWDAKDKKWYVGAPYPVAASKNMTAIFACWHHASTFAWGTHKVGNANVSYEPSLQWAKVPATTPAQAQSGWINHTNSYDNSFFGKTLSNLILSGYLKVSTDAKDCKLTVGSQVNPYFTPAITEEGVISFTQTQEENAPGVDHKETLSFVVIDAFGHKATIELPVTIKKP